MGMLRWQDMDQSRIRNFCIIAHIDHGKSTLADRFLELTSTISSREMAEQVLDQMELERERGITIKATAVRMNYLADDGERYELNLIDTPGHVDFTYEVSRALAACEGAVLVVDASQGIEAQTVANVLLALQEDLHLLGVVNKIDLPGSEPSRVAAEIVEMVGLSRQDIVLASAKEGRGIREILEMVVHDVPPPNGRSDGPPRALIFDSNYDPYKGVIVYVRMVDGAVSMGQVLLLMASGQRLDPLEVGILQPQMISTGKLSTGQVGYIATGLKEVQRCRVGDTITAAHAPAEEALAGYRPAKPMVFAGLYPASADDYGLLKDALGKLQLNDAALSYKPESSVALGPGFHCGFLGLLHMEIVQERLEREFFLELIATVPSVEYQLLLTDGQEIVVDNPSDLPAPQKIQETREPWMNVSVIAPDRYTGSIMELVTNRRGRFLEMEYMERSAAAQTGHSRTLLRYEIPLAEMLVGFYDRLKAVSQGFASMDYGFAEYRVGGLVKLDILVNQQPVDALGIIVPETKARQRGRELIDQLKSLIPRQLFDVPLQAVVAGKVVARETVRARRKNVLAKCYGGDVTRKRKLLERQKEGKRRMKRIGQVDIPQDAFLALLKIKD